MKVLNNSVGGTVYFRDCIELIRHFSDKRDYRTLYHNCIKKVLGAKYAYSFGSGRGSLYAILNALGIGSGDEVIIQGYTCVAVPKAIMYTGALPVYADISRTDYNMSLDSVEKLISSKTKAIIIQHTYGIPAKEIFSIKALCENRSLYLIEDCAHVLGISYKGRKLGTIGDAAFFSTDHTKYISTIAGGFATTSDDNIGSKLAEEYEKTTELTLKERISIIITAFTDCFFRQKRVHWVFKNYTLFGLIETIFRLFNKKILRVYDLSDYRHMSYPTYTFPGRLSNMQAYLGIKQLKGLKENIKHRKELTTTYKSRLESRYYIPQEANALLRLPLIVDNPDDWSEMLSEISDVERWFSHEILCIDRSDYDKVFFEPSSCPVAADVSRHIINFPINNKVSIADVNTICDVACKMNMKRNERTCLES